MLLQQQVGPSQNSDGTYPNIRGGKMGDIIVSELMPRYYEQTYRGNVFSACNTAAATIGVLTLTGVTYHLYNPPSSGKNLVILTASFGPSSATFAAGVVHFAYNIQTATPTGVTALTIKNNLLTGAAASSVATVYSAATLAAVPLAVRPFFASPATTSTAAVAIKDEVAGEMILAPSGVLSIQGNAAAIAVGFIGMSWLEVAV